MEDVLTEIPPPSRFFQEDLNNFTPASPPLPSPFLLFSNPKPDLPLRPSLLIITLSTQSHYVFHQMSPKMLVGGLFLPEIPFSGNTIEPSLGDKSCNVYALGSADNLTLLVSVQYSVSAERSNVVAKLLVGEKIIPERVLILDSIQSRNFRGRLSSDVTYAFKLETSAERKHLDDCGGNSLLPNDVNHFPSGSVVDGLAAALLAKCQMRNIRAALLVTWPNYVSSVVALIKSLLQRNVLRDVNMSLNGDDENKHQRFSQMRDQPFDSELYT
uniref:Uncharacterized protein MANES_06G077700 n=1 Tax=Rhizophora mucronata TaxID=61149 RepID=A0A2P2IWC0_RHIMU